MDAKFITGSVQLVPLKKPRCQPHTVNYSFPVCVYDSRKWEIHPPPCLKGRKQCERREDVSDLAEGSPGLTLKPRRLNGRPSREDERSSPQRWQGGICEEMVKNKQRQCREQGKSMWLRWALPWQRALWENASDFLLNWTCKRFNQTWCSQRQLWHQS